MITMDQLLGMMLTQAHEPSSHFCPKCRSSFSADSDGCPSCGTNTPVTLVPELQDKEKKEKEERV